MEEKNTSGIEPKLAAALSYAAGWITGLVFYFILEKENKYVRFHAMQSIITFGALTGLLILAAVISFFCALAAPGFAEGGVSCLFNLINIVIMLAGLVLWVLLILKAYQGEKYKLPFAGDMAEKHTNNP